MPAPADSRPRAVEEKSDTWEAVMERFASVVMEATEVVAASWVMKRGSNSALKVVV